MTDIEKLRQDVIDAARAAHNNDWMEWSIVPVCDALDALDAAETPDPWALLRVIRADLASRGIAHDRIDKIDAALAWHERQEEQDA